MFGIGPVGAGRGSSAGESTSTPSRATETHRMVVGSVWAQFEVHSAGMRVRDTRHTAEHRAGAKQKQAVVGGSATAEGGLGSPHVTVGGDHRDLVAYSSWEHTVLSCRSSWTDAPTRGPIDCC